MTKVIKSNHGLSRHPLNNTWASIRARCNNPKSKKYIDYGARGVRICDEWNDFVSFYEWCITNGWKAGMQIDKDLIPRKLGVPALLYSPDMCSIITCKENQNAKRNNRVIEYNGVSMTMADWAREIGVGRHLLWQRLKKGWSVRKAIETPLNKSFSHKKYKFDKT